VRASGPSPGGLPNDVVYTISIDKLGNRWFGTGRSGIAMFLKGGVAALYRSGEPPPLEHALYPNYPNPFNSTTGIIFTMPDRNAVPLSIYTILDDVVSTLISEVLSAGTYRTRWRQSGCRAEPILCGYRESEQLKPVNCFI